MIRRILVICAFVFLLAPRHAESGVVWQARLEFGWVYQTGPWYMPFYFGDGGVRTYDDLDNACLECPDSMHLGPGRGNVDIQGGPPVEHTGDYFRYEDVRLVFTMPWHQPDGSPATAQLWINMPVLSFTLDYPYAPHIPDDEAFFSIFPVLGDGEINAAMANYLGTSRRKIRGGNLWLEVESINGPHDGERFGSIGIGSAAVSVAPEPATGLLAMFSGAALLWRKTRASRSPVRRS